MTKIKGKIWKYGDDINTDVIFPGKYTYTVTDFNEMAKHALEDLDPNFSKEVKRGDVIVAGYNFGCGSSREQAASCLVSAGVGAVIAKSFSRIFFRNAINWGLPVITNSEIQDLVKKGDEIEIDLEDGKIYVKGKEFTFPPLRDEVKEILDAGGLINYLKKKLKEGK